MTDKQRQILSTYAALLNEHGLKVRVSIYSLSMLAYPKPGFYTTIVLERYLILRWSNG